MKNYEFKKVTKTTASVIPTYDTYRCCFYEQQKIHELKCTSQSALIHGEKIPTKQTVVEFELYKFKSGYIVKDDENSEVTTIALSDDVTDKGFLCKIYAYPTHKNRIDVHCYTKVIKADTYPEALEQAKKEALSWLHDVIYQTYDYAFELYQDLHAYLY